MGTRKERERKREKKCALLNAQRKKIVLVDDATHSQNRHPKDGKRQTTKRKKGGGRDSILSGLMAQRKRPDARLAVEGFF